MLASGNVCWGLSWLRYFSRRTQPSMWVEASTREKIQAPRVDNLSWACMLIHCSLLQTGYGVISCYLDFPTVMDKKLKLGSHSFSPKLVFSEYFIISAGNETKDRYCIHIYSLMARAKWYSLYDTKFCCYEERWQASQSLDIYQNQLS